MKSIGIVDLIMSIGMFITISGSIIMLISLICDNKIFLTFGNLILYNGILIIVIGPLIAIIKKNKEVKI